MYFKGGKGGKGKKGYFLWNVVFFEIIKQLIFSRDIDNSSCIN